MNNLRSIHDIVQKQENEFERGDTRLSKYVTFSIGETIARTDAAINSTFLHGDTDSKGNKKAYSNISNPAVNIWFRATDIDRSFIKIRPTPGNRLNAMLATATLQEWMRKERFGQFLNKWGRVLARNGSAVTKFVNKNGELVPSVISWSKIICDSVDFHENPVSEILDLTEQQLWERVRDNGYDKEMVEGLIDATTTRKNRDGTQKDNNDSYYRVYEVHGNLSEEYLTDEKEDRDNFVPQMHVISYVGKGTKDQKDFTLFKGKERITPYILSHLLEEDGRTLAIGAVENLFNAQWMQNKSAKQINDQLEFASKQFYQSTDQQFLGSNALSDLDNGHIFVTGVGGNITQVNNQSHDITQIQNNSNAWKQVGNELNGISEAMLGAMPKSGTAWRQTEAVLQENHSLFDIMIENKGLAIDDMLRIHVLPFLKKNRLNNSDEIVAIFDAAEIEWIDTKYLKVMEQELTIEKILDLETDLDVTQDLQDIAQAIGDNGNMRSFKPSMLDSKTWKEQLENLEWDVEIDVTGEVKDLREAMTTLNTALQVMMNPAFQQSPEAQKVVAKALELSGTLSPLELSTLSSTMKTTQQASAPVGEAAQLQGNETVNVG